MRAEGTFLPKGRHLPAGLREDMWAAFRQQEVREFIIRMCAGYEATLRKLWIEKGGEPTKTAVAEAMNIGSKEYRLTSFINKLTRLGINYQTIVDRVKCSLENPS